MRESNTSTFVTHFYHFTTVICLLIKFVLKFVNSTFLFFFNILIFYHLCIVHLKLLIFNHTTYQFTNGSSSYFHGEFQCVGFITFFESFWKYSWIRTDKLLHHCFIFRCLRRIQRNPQVPLSLFKILRQTTCCTIQNEKILHTFVW
jgi:hypothetical protein